MSTPSPSASSIKPANERTKRRCAPSQTGRTRSRPSAVADVTVREDGDVRIVQVGPMGPYGNNAYIVRDVAAGASLLVDMPLEEGPLLEPIAAEGGVQQVIATHWHPDHWATYDAVRSATGAPVLAGAVKLPITAELIDGRP